MRPTLFAACAALSLLAGCSYFTPTTTTAADGTVTTGPSKADASLAQANAALPDAYKLGCGAISVAHGYFLAAAPALVVAGKLNQSAVDAENAVFTVDQARCATPPTDVATAGAALLADAGAVYVLIAQHQ